MCKFSSFYFDLRVLRKKKICFWHGVLNFHLKLSSFNKHSCVARSCRHKESTQSARWPRFGMRTGWQNKLREEPCQSIIHLPPCLKTHFLLYIVLQLKLHRRGGKLDRPCCVQLFLGSGSLQFPVFTPLFCVMMLSTLLFKGKAKSLLKIMIVIEILWRFSLWWTRKYKKHWISRDGRVVFLIGGQSLLHRLDCVLFHSTTSIQEGGGKTWPTKKCVNS